MRGAGVPCGPLREGGEGLPPKKWAVLVGGVQPVTLTPSSFSLKCLSEERERGSCKNKREVEEELLVGEVSGGGGGEGGQARG